MRRMSPDYSGNAYKHSRGLAYDYNYDPSNRDSPGKAGKLDPYSDDYSIPPKSPPRRSRSFDAYSNAGTSSRRPDCSRKDVARVGRMPTPAIPDSPSQESLKRSNKVTPPSASSKRNFSGKVDPYSEPFSVPSISPPRIPRSPKSPHRSSQSPDAGTSSRHPDHPGKGAVRVGRKPTPPPIPASPTLEYLRTSLEPSNKLTSPSASRKLLILDLNGTLVFRSPHRKDFYQHATYSTPRPVRHVYPRPYLPSLRDYLFHPTTRTWLDTMVWSSAQPHSVADMVDKCFAERKEELVAVWARDTLGLDEQSYHRKSETTKDLAKPWSALHLDSTTSADSAQKHSALTTILVDDSPLKAKLQPYNHLCVREYAATTRGTDVAVRDAEVLAARAKLSVPTFKVDETEDRISAKKRKRKEKKRGWVERKKAEKKLWKVGEKARVLGGEYDEMLLAVVGILEEVKVQGNVAGWMRGGGLMLGEEGEGEVDSSAKKRRLSDGAEISDSPGTPPPPSSPSPQPLLEEDASTSAITPSAFTGIPMNKSDTEETSIWFEDQELVEWWADMGRVALDGLGIEVVSGVVGTYDR